MKLIKALPLKKLITSFFFRLKERYGNYYLFDTLSSTALRLKSGESIEEKNLSIAISSIIFGTMAHSGSESLTVEWKIDKNIMAMVRKYAKDPKIIEAAMKEGTIPEVLVVRGLLQKGVKGTSIELNSKTIDISNLSNILGNVYNRTTSITTRD